MEHGECWYTVFCKPRQEAIAEENLLRQGFHVHLPRISTRQWQRGRWVDIVEPLFPRYLFVRVDFHRRSMAPIRSTRGAVGLVRFGSAPAVVPHDVMAALLERADPSTGLHRDDQALFRSGDLVKLVDGPLAGLQGVFSQKDGDERVIVLLELLGKANTLRISRDWIARAA